MIQWLAADLPKYLAVRIPQLSSPKARPATKKVCTKEFFLIYTDIPMIWEYLWIRLNRLGIFNDVMKKFYPLGNPRHQTSGADSVFVPERFIWK